MGWDPATISCVIALGALIVTIITLLVNTGGYEIRAKILARLIIKGKMTLSEVSENLPNCLEDVKKYLVEFGHPELAK